MSKLVVLTTSFLIFEAKTCQNFGFFGFPGKFFAVFGFKMLKCWFYDQIMSKFWFYKIKILIFQVFSAPKLSVFRSKNVKISVLFVELCQNCDFSRSKCVKILVSRSKCVKILVFKSKLVKIGQNFDFLYFSWWCISVRNTIAGLNQWIWT